MRIRLQIYASNPSFVEAGIDCYNFDDSEIISYLSQFPRHTSNGLHAGSEIPIPGSSDCLVVMGASFISRMTIQRSNHFRFSFSYHRL